MNEILSKNFTRLEQSLNDDLVKLIKEREIYRQLLQTEIRKDYTNCANDEIKDESALCSLSIVNKRIHNTEDQLKTIENIKATITKEYYDLQKYNMIIHTILKKRRNKEIKQRSKALYKEFCNIQTSILLNKNIANIINDYVL